MSTTDNTMLGRDLFLRHTDKNGNSYVACHRVWDAERFFLSQNAAARKEGPTAGVEQISEQQYQAERSRK